MTCSIQGCGKPKAHRGWCKGHYLRWHRHGDPLLGGPSPKRPMTRQEAFSLEVPERPLEGECHPWTGGRDEYGYGYVVAENKVWKAHRVSYEMFTGSITPGEVIRHICDNPPCVNPAHLLAGTQADNVEDMVSRERHNRGSKNGAAKLTEDDVREIRDLQGQMSAIEIGRLYGVTRRVINRIHNREMWKHVE